MQYERLESMRAWNVDWKRRRNCPEIGQAVSKGPRLVEAQQDKKLMNGFSGVIGGSFAGVAGLFALFFFSDVPKVRKDIMQV
jgi:Ubiquinol-cytochrome-c reductase complex subunit (QCR10)